MGVVGPNGAGKTTLLNSLIGLTTPLSGSVEFFGQSYKKARSRIGYMPQQRSVDWDFPTTVFDVVLMGTYGALGWFKRPGDKEKALAEQALKEVGMIEFANRQIGELSGGQKQRTFLARALVESPDLYLMDEPFQGVDAASEKAIVAAIHKLREQGKTIIIVHHDLSTVKTYCDWITLLRVGIVASGPVADVFTDDNLRKTYGRSNSFIDAEAVGL
ncbi:zinc ABC transporter ATP-binding protein [Vibrio nigripulchritudo]|nr:zinc ABC transporter ATP-binding protein [Vibrio nigripulchritudo]BDU45431.1 zinc ABC transporter ATP-binding protein [Vibrio nigripulchritudo]